MLSSLRSRLTYANVMATLAMFVALGGSSYAAITITGRNVKDSSLTGADIKNSSLTTSDVKDRSLLAKDFKAGQLPKGERGATGATGATGQQGPAGRQGDPGVPAARAWARISNDAGTVSVLASSGGVTANLQATGFVRVIVPNANADSCAAVVSIDAGGGNPGNVRKYTTGSGGSTFLISAADLQGNFVDRSFDIAVFC